jgi:hypothetical protein
MLNLEEAETVIACFRPSLSAFSPRPGYCCQERDCGRVPYRVTLIRSPKGRRSVALCGLHFIEATKRYPQLGEKVKKCIGDPLNDELILEVVASRETAPSKLPVSNAAMVSEMSEIECPHCHVSYAAGVDLFGSPVGAEVVRELDLTDSIKTLQDRISSEHASGHSSQRLSVVYAAKLSELSCDQNPVPGLSTREQTGGVNIGQRPQRQPG